MPSDRERTPATAPPSTSLWIPTLTVASGLLTAYLAILVVRLQPLPFLDFGAAGLVAVAFGAASILVLVGVIRLPVYSFSLVFAVGTLVMSTSAFLLYSLEGDLAFAGFKVLYSEAWLRGVPVVMLAFASLTLGSVVAHGRRGPVTPAPARFHPRVAATHNTAIVLYCFFLVVLFVFSLRGPGVFTAITSGYSGGSGFADMRKAGAMSTAVTASIAWFLPWLSVILLATSRSERQFARSTLLAALVCVICLLTGDRTVTVIMIALLLQIRHLLGYSVRWRRIALLGALTAFIVVTWPMVRTVPVREWRPAVLVEVVQAKFRSPSATSEEYSSPIAHLFAVNATSYQPIMFSCHYVPEIESYRLGFDFLRSAATAVPFAATSFADFLRPDEMPGRWMLDKIDPNFWTGRGFNQIAEAYIQGGGIAVAVIYLLLGWYLAWLWWRLPGEGDLRLLAFHALVVASLYKWIRNDSGGVGRNILWAIVLVYLLPMLAQWLHERLAGSPSQPAPGGGETPLPYRSSN